MRKEINYIKYILQFCCILVVFNSLYFISSQKHWSPIDEYAHMDYIEKLSVGQFPKISDTLSSEIIYDIQNVPTRSVAKMTQNINEMGLALYSYQAKHPPIYYSLLVLPNLVLKYVEMPIFQRVELLRVLSYGFYVLGVWMLIPVFHQLRNIGFNIPDYFIYLVCILSLLIFPHERYGLGNNALSPFMIHANMYYLIRLYRTSNTKYLNLLTLLTTISCGVALTNIFIAPIILLLGVLFILKKRMYLEILIQFIFMLPALGIGLIWIYLSQPDPIIGASIELLLKTYIPASMVNFPLFLKVLYNDLFTITLGNSTFNFGILFISLLIMGCLRLVFRFKTFKENHTWLIVPFVFIFILLIEMYILNRYVDSVTWVAFRHYLGFVGILSTCIVALFLPAKYVKH